MGFNKKTIDKDVPIPLYYQLKTIIQEMIQSGELSPGDMIPTEKDFAELYHISRTTIRQAITELVADGFLYRIKSKGTFVAKPKIENQHIQKMDVRHEFLKDQNVVPTTKLLSKKIVPADNEVAKQMDIKPGEEVLRVEMVRLADNDPLVYHITYLSTLCLEVLNFDVEKNGLNSFLYSNKITRPVQSSRWFEAILADRKLSERLEMPRFSAIQLIRTVNRNFEGKPIEYTIGYFRGDRNIFVMELSL